MRGKRTPGGRLILSAILILSLIPAVVAAEETITIGATLGMTGPPPIAKASIPLDIALKDCFAIANEEGGINGKKIRYVMKDDQYKAEVGLRVFEELISSENPLCVLARALPWLWLWPLL